MDNVTKAKINLFAVLRNIQDLCELDDVSKDIIKDEKTSVSFNVPDVGTASLIFKDGKCTFVPDQSKAQLKLWFNSPEHFNKLIDGEKTIPMFINIFKVGFLLNTFTKLADRLSYFLKPTEELLKDRKYFEINTILTAYTAFFAMCQIGNSDEVGKIVASRIVDGDIACGIPGGIQVTINVTNGVMSARLGGSENPRAVMEFADLDFAHDLLNGKTSSYKGLGEGKFLIKGKLSMLDQVSKLLTMVGHYLM
ncbi:MAG: hypothetical protein GX242_05165 [Clostridiales bacterium]|nr:hypothetical protein [Clostridiales bacterium]